MWLVSLFVRAPNFSLFKPLRSVTLFLCLGRARIIHDTNEYIASIKALASSAPSDFWNCQG